MDAAHKSQLVRTVWGLELDERTNRTLDAYFKYCWSQMGGNAAQVLFFVTLLKQNTQIPRTHLERAMKTIQNGGSDANTQQVHWPELTDSARSALSDPHLNIGAALAQAARLVWATHLTTGRNEIVSYSVKVHWDESNTLESVLSNAFPKSVSRDNFTPAQIKRSKLNARYLCDHADIKLEWTRHLPDHLDLDRDGKKLRVFELVSMLEISKKTPGAMEGKFADSLRQGCFQEDFIVETLMTVRLLFPPRDRAWLNSIISPPKKRHRLLLWGRKDPIPSRDARLSAPFDLQIKGTRHHEKFRRSILTTADLFEVFPHWAPRLQLIYEEAEDPTPSSTVGRWAERRKGPRHTYWITVAAFSLAILFGLAATILGALQLWVSYCQWQVPDGGFGCGAKHSNSSDGSMRVKQAS